MKKNCFSGFSLLELLIVITISSTLILFIAQLYRMVGQTVNTLFSNNDQWLFERFIRKQTWFMDHRFYQDKLFSLNSHDLIFVSQYSAQYALAGPPTLVKYHYDDDANTLFYSEMAIPPWWDDKLKYFRHDELFNSQNPQWHSIAINKIDDFSFSYFDGKNWDDRWSSTTQLPLLVKMQFTRTGAAIELILETKGLSYSMPSGF